MGHSILWQNSSNELLETSSQRTPGRSQLRHLAVNVQGSLGRKQRLKQGRPKPFVAAVNIKDAAVNVEDAAQIERSSSKQLKPDLQSVVGSLEQSLSIDTSASNAALTSMPETAIPEEFKSTLRHKLITGGTMVLLSMLMLKGVSEMEGPADFTAGVAASLFGYFLSDFLTGVYHWGVDNYGDGSTPVVGSQIEAFQGHHQKPWTITEREFCNNLHKVFLPVAPFTAFCLLLSPWTPSWLDIGLAVATGLTAMSQQFHAWAHMKPSDLPEPVKVLQEAGILVSRRAHGAHHKAPFEGNYCIVSGFWNPILDQDGSDSSFFRSFERLVKDRTGVEPRCWYEPDYSWQEE